MHIENMTRKDFEAVQYREKWNKPVICSTLVILPTRHKHDSGFRSMDFVAVDADGEPICRLAGGSDVLHLDGIGGYGLDWRNNPGSVPAVVPVSAWSIDCLPKSGLLHIWPTNTKRREIYCGESLSSFEIFAVEG